VYRIPPGPGRGHQLGHGVRTSGGCGTAPGSGSEAPGRHPGRRLMPAAQPTKSPGTPPGDDDLNAAAAHPGRPQTARAARRAAPSARRPGPPGTGPRRAPVRERQVLPPARQHHGHRSPDVAGPLRRRRPGLPTGSRLTGQKDRSFPRATAGPAGLPSHADQRAWHSRTVWQAPARRGN
jgi:hypothetical protein